MTSKLIADHPRTYIPKSHPEAPPDVARASTRAASTFMSTSGPGSVYAGLIDIDPISRVSIVTQLICRLYPLGVRV
jgi:hypothetical protein